MRSLGCSCIVCLLSLKSSVILKHWAYKHICPHKSTKAANMHQKEPA